MDTKIIFYTSVILLGLAGVLAILADSDLVFVIYPRFLADYVFSVAFAMGIAGISIWHFAITEAIAPWPKKRSMWQRYFRPRRLVPVGSALLILYFSVLPNPLYLFYLGVAFIFLPIFASLVLRVFKKDS